MSLRVHICKISAHALRAYIYMYVRMYIGIIHAHTCIYLYSTLYIYICTHILYPFLSPTFPYCPVVLSESCNIAG